MPDHPCGWLAIRHQLGCPILLAEDATRAADSARLRHTPAFTRDATDTERQLLVALEHADETSAAELSTAVDGNPAVPTRQWPNLTP